MGPILKDTKGTLPANRWDFLEGKNIILNHNIPYETVLQWGDDCLCFGLNNLSITGLTYEHQYQD